MAVAPLRFARLKGLILVVALALAPAAARADDTQHAKELFQQGTTLFNLGQFDQAIEAWQEGYKAKPDPGFLYNIGQAYRLKGDAPKAIFFYRGYLRNSPKAPNRADIEAKIATLQKETSDPKAATPSTPAAPPPVAPAPRVAPPPVAPAPRVAPPPVAPAPRVAPLPVAPAPRVAPPPPALGPTPVAPPPMVAPPLPEPVPVPEAPAPVPEPSASDGERRPWDVSVGLGFAKWTSGLNIKDSAPLQLAWSVAGGYAFGDVFGPASFRLGGFIERTTLDEGSAPANTLSFTSFLVEPSVRVRLVERRLYLTGALGIGGMAIGGVLPKSVVLDPKEVAKGLDPHGGALAAFVVRPAVAVQVHLTPGLVLFASPALSFSPKPAHFYKPLDRFELLFGVAYFL